MAKRISIVLITVLLVLGLASCNNNPGGGGSSEPTRPATLSVNNYIENYPVGAEKPSGVLIYTSTAGKITTVDINDEGVTTDFNASVAADNKILKISYKGIDVAKTYNVVQMEEVDISGTYIVDKNTTLTFKKGSTSVDKDVWSSWGQFYNLDSDPVTTELTYTVGLSPAGRTVIRVNNWSYIPKDGGLASYPSEAAYFEYDSGYAPSTTCFYVSTAKEDNRSTTNAAARNKYLVMKFDVEGNAYFWFTADVESATLTALTDGDAVKILANQMAFDQAGLNFKGVTVEGKESVASNLEILLNKEGYASTTKAFGFISSTGSGYQGYYYTMKLSDVLIP